MKNKIFVGLAIVIIIGLIVIAVLGFNVDGCYKDYNLVGIQIGQEFEISDVKAITNEVFGNSKVEVEKAGIFSNYAFIRVNEINEEQRNLLNTKINEKYGTENKEEDIKVEYIPRVRLLDIVKPYIIPFTVVTVLVLLYMGIRYGKIGNIAVKTVIIQTLGLTALAELLYFSIIAITRYPVNRLVMPVAMVIYMTIITALTSMFEKQNIGAKNKKNN